MPKTDDSHCVLCGCDLDPHAICTATTCQRCAPAWTLARRNCAAGLGRVHSDAGKQRARREARHLFFLQWRRRPVLLEAADPYAQPPDPRPARLRHVLEYETDGIELSALAERFGFDERRILDLAARWGLLDRVICFGPVQVAAAAARHEARL